MLPSRAKRGTSLCEEQLGSRPDSLLASYLVGFTLKTLISSSASLLAYFHEVLRHLQNVFFLYSKGLSPPYRFVFKHVVTLFFLCFIRSKNLKCPCSFLQSLVLERSGCTYRETEEGHATKRHYVSEGAGCCAR